MSAMELLKVIVILQLLFSFSVTLISHSLPSDVLKQFTESELQLQHSSGSSKIISKFNQTVTEMKGLPLVNTAFLLFYTGNLVIDLLMNFVFAIPEMLTVPWNLFSYFFHIDATYQVAISGLIFAISTIIYLAMIIGVISSIRSGRSVV